MKFGKRLKRQIEESLPEWKDKFLSYKDLKKLVKLVSTTQPCSKAEQEFICLLDIEIDKFNSFFVEQEEDFIIRQRELQERIKRVVEEYGPAGRQPSEADYAAEMGKIRKDIVNFHGEMVLLVNYSSINYTGLAKILKKYDKRTGRLLRLPFIKKVLEQPFFTTDLLSKLVKECESTIDAVFPVVIQEQNGVVEKEALIVSEKSILRNTLAALMTMQELRGGSSTISQFSLPPLSLADTELLNSFQLPSPIAIQ